ncbi:MAG: tail fiber domain-containing protein [Flavitalea sp.]
MKKILYTICSLSLIATGVNGQIGFGTASPNSSLDVRGGFAVNIRTFSSNTSVDITDYAVAFTGTSDASVSLPDATTCTGRIYWIKNASSTLPTPVVTINTASSQTIDGQASTLLDEPYEVIRLVSDGTGWTIAGQDVPAAKSSTIGGAWNQGGNSIKTMKSLGTVTNFDFPFLTNNTEAMRLTTGGFLGIGTPSPAGRLHFVNDNNDAGNDYIFSDFANGASITQGFKIRKSGGTISAAQNLQNGDTIGQIRMSPRTGGAVNYFGGSGLDAAYKGDGTTAFSDLRFNTSAFERFRINENGKVTIDTTAPDGLNPEKLLVEAGHTTSYNVISGKGSINNYLQLNIQNTSATALASSDLVASADNGNESENYIDMGINSSAYSNIAAPILNGVNRAYLFGTGSDFVIGNGTPGSDLILFTGGYAAANERMRITAAGNVGVGTTTPAEKLSVGGIMTPKTDNSFTLGNTTNRWKEVWAANGALQTSDVRLKTNIQPLAYGIEELMKMHPVSYNWKTSPATNHKVGLIAQEVQLLAPEIVTGDATKENLGMNYGELAPLLIKAIQQQQQRLASLKAELAKLTEPQN